jgi:ABC-2 type transport system ATP-binding protein
VHSLLSAQQLTVRFPGGVTALDRLDLEIPNSGITCLLGANGAGKTTLLEAAAGLQPLTQGLLRVLDRDPGSDANRSTVGVMLQDGGLPGSARPRAFVSYVARMYPHPRDVDEVLRSVDVDPDTRAPIRRLSGGEQRRVSWAAAMVGNPTALLLDEPTAGVDPIGRDHLQAILRTQRRQGVSMIVATHLVEDVEAFADAVVVLREGSLVLAGLVEELRPRDALIVRSPRPLDGRAVLAALPSGTSCRTISSIGRSGVADTISYVIHLPTDIDPSVMATVSSWCAQHSVPADITTADLGSVLWSALRGERW